MVGWNGDRYNTPAPTNNTRYRIKNSSKVDCFPLCKKKPPHIVDMSITSNANSTFLNVDNAHLRVSGDIHATAVKVGAIEIVPGYSLESTTGIGNTTPHTIEFTNTETSLVTSGDINMLHSSNNATIKLNSNVVTEFPRSKKLIKYPRVALTSASYNAYESGYKVTVSGFVNSSNHPGLWGDYGGYASFGLNYDERNEHIWYNRFEVIGV